MSKHTDPKFTAEQIRAGAEYTAHQALIYSMEGRGEWIIETHKGGFDDGYGEGIVVGVEDPEPIGSKYELVATCHRCVQEDEEVDEDNTKYRIEYRGITVTPEDEADPEADAWVRQSAANSLQLMVEDGLSVDHLGDVTELGRDLESKVERFEAAIERFVRRAQDGS